MQYELQTLVVCPSDSNDCHNTLVDAAKDLEAKLKAAGVGYVLEVRDIRRGSRLFRSIDPGRLTTKPF